MQPAVSAYDGKHGGEGAVTDKNGGTSVREKRQAWQPVSGACGLLATRVFIIYTCIAVPGLTQAFPLLVTCAGPHLVAMIQGVCLSLQCLTVEPYNVMVSREGL